MTLAVGLRQRNIDLSLLRIVQTRFATGAYATRTFAQDALADPTALDERKTALRYWVEVSFPSHGTGQKVPTIMQVDCFYAVGDLGNQGTSDQYGHKTTDVADDFVAAMTPANVGLTVYDYDNPASPVATTEWVLIRNSRGQQGWPESRQRVFAERGLVRETLTYHVWHRQDLHGVQGYF